MKIRRYLYILISLIILIIFSYWLKCQLGINFSDSITPSDFVPFKYLTRNNVIKEPEPGVLINESFDSSIWKLNNWTGLWMAEPGKVTQGFDNSGYNNSQSLLIKSKSSKYWACSHNMFIQVKPGDSFIFEGLVIIDGQAATAYLEVASFDINKKVMKWNYVKKRIDERGVWIKANEHFKVSDGIEYIRLRLTGSGIGEFRFDDIKLVKE